MAAVAGKETKPEIAVRKFLFSQGFRYRKNVKELPGKPDLVLPKYKALVFVHGCFWHGHGCKKAALPTSNIEFWESKIQSNIVRDVRHQADLEKAGWKVIIIWECEINGKEKFLKKMETVVEEIRSTTL